MNSLWLIASVSVALTALIAEAAFSLPLPQENQSIDSLEEVAQKVAQVGVEVPICYMETADGRFLDLTGLCEEQAGGSNMISSVSPAPSVYDSSDIKKFDDELYGEEE